MTVIVNDQRRYPQGVPCWVDTEQPDPVAASRFYAGLFGWEFHDAMPPGAPGSYLIATLDGHDVAAVGPGEGGTVPQWHTYVACDDADEVSARMTSAGGTVLSGPEDAGPGGRTATCADPSGAEFRLWQARRRLGAQWVNVANTWNFSDLVTPDADAVLPFYTEVFGWELDTDSGMIRLPGYGDHLAATIDPDIYERQAGHESFADVVAGLSTGEPAWVVRFNVADRDASVASAERLGATVISSADTDYTRESVILDPQGARLTLSQFTPPDA